MLRKNDRIGELEFQDSEGINYRLEQFRNLKAVALFFYPMDFTRICTAQACHFRERYEEIQKLGGELFGVSLDDNATHNSFISKHQLPFPLIFDNKKQLGKEFGVLRLGGILRNKRATFIISPEGIIVDVIHNELNAEIHADRFIDVLKSMGS
ncbi:peroxiredoxin [bacterium]|nr:peroxiredoxin [bacterium]